MSKKKQEKDEKVAEAVADEVVEEAPEVEVIDAEAEVVEVKILDSETDGESEIDEIIDFETQAAEYLDGWQRARAELANVKKRMERERKQVRETVRSDMVMRFLPALDDLDLAITNLPDDLKDHDWVNGVLLVHKKLAAQLEELGVSEIEAAGEDFDPTFHEAVAQIPHDDYESGTVIDVLRKGYRLGEKVIRAALVRVAG